MQPVRFQRVLFGFRRRQVLAYINEAHADFARQLTEQQTALQTEYDGLKAELEGRLAEQTACAARAMAEAEDCRRAKQEAEQAAALQQQLAEAARHDAAAGQAAAAEKEERLAEKDRVIAGQAEELARLQEQLGLLEEEFSSLRQEAEQNTALVNCVSLLHGRNRALTQKVARLEAQLQNGQTDRAVEHCMNSAGENAQAVQSTEQLFARVREEIAQALQSISDKIQNDGAAAPAAADRFVDLAQL